MKTGRPGPQNTTPRTRTYKSPRRQQQAAETKAAVLDAARVLFSEQGWSGTGMRDIAAAAGVAVETVYALFGSKPDLFQATYDAAVAGDLSPLAIAERPEFLALSEMGPREAARSAARMVSRFHQHEAGLERALREAAASDPSLGRLLADNEERRRSDVARGLELVNKRRPTPTERDACWAVESFEVFDLLVQRSGWSVRRYEAWLADVLAYVGQRATEGEEG